MPESRYDLAEQYQAQRSVVIRSHGAAHARELRKLTTLSKRLHTAEIDAGVPMGSTRVELGYAHA